MRAFLYKKLILDICCLKNKHLDVGEMIEYSAKSNKKVLLKIN